MANMMQSLYSDSMLKCCTAFYTHLCNINRLDRRLRGLITIIAVLLRKKTNAGVKQCTEVGWSVGCWLIKLIWQQIRRLLLSTKRDNS